jgi:hypothetical protein
MIEVREGTRFSVKEEEEKRRERKGEGEEGSRIRVGKRRSKLIKKRR